MISKLSKPEAHLADESLNAVRQQLQDLLSKLDVIPECAMSAIHLHQSIIALPVDYPRLWPLD